VDVVPKPVIPNYHRFVAAIRAGRQVAPDFARGAALQRVLDLAIVSDQQSALDQVI
ncbi:MAG: urate hydroxylase PuuD, partial [Paracoccaceae bacterium]|nr:urate hydroxylase PuuD [Paracoccaceae bacterium]